MERINYRTQNYEYTSEKAMYNYMSEIYPSFYFDFNLSFLSLIFMYVQ